MTLHTIMILEAETFLKCRRFDEERGNRGLPPRAGQNYARIPVVSDPTAKAGGL
jgi:hypothetical protein